MRTTIYRVSIGEATLRKLMRGEVVTLDEYPSTKIELALKDIGWERMQKALDEAIADAYVKRFNETKP